MTRMNDTIYEALFGFCETYGYDFHENYSGRGMYGKTCIGISTSKQGFQLGLELAAFITEHYEEDACDMLNILAENCDHDQLGLGMITYFRGIQARKGPEPLDDM